MPPSKSLRDRVDLKDASLYVGMMVIIAAFMVTAVIRKGSDAIGICILFLWVQYKLFCKATGFTNHYSFPTVTPNSMAIGAMFVVYVVFLCIVCISSDNSIERFRSLAGLLLLIVLFYATSHNRSVVNFRTVVCGLYFQLLLAMFVLKTNIGLMFFGKVAEVVNQFMEVSKVGLEFVFGADVAQAQIFATSVFPAVIFFASFIQVLYYLGVMQYIVKHVAKLMVFVMDTSGSESIVAAASPFVGQGESALLVEPFVEYMTNSELHAVMVSGFAAVSGSVLIAFMSFGIDSVSLLTGSVISTPCSLIFSKLRYPESEESLTKGQVKIPKSEKKSNVLDAAGEGAITGVKISGIIAGSIIAFISLFELLNGMIGYLCSFLIDTPVTAQLILSLIFQPFSFFMGVPLPDIPFVSELLGTKLVVNEFAAYMALADAEVDPRTAMLATYALCGFANVASIGITVGTISSITPSRQHDLARLGVSAMLTGACCTIANSCIAGVIV